VRLQVMRQGGGDRVLMDGGGEFKAEFAQACTELGIRHMRIKPRHSWTNGFVERLHRRS
jgi:transposase InsO family protein